MCMILSLHGVQNVACVGSAIQALHCDPFGSMGATSVRTPRRMRVRSIETVLSEVEFETQDRGSNNYSALEQSDMTVENKRRVLAEARAVSTMHIAQ